MTIEQIVSRFAQFPFLTSLVVIGLGLLLGFLIAWIFWRKRHRSWKAALRRKEELASEAEGYKSRNRYFQSLTAERQKLAAEMDWSKFDFVSPELAVKLKEYGIKDLANLKSLSETQRGKLDSELAANGLSLNWDSVGKAQASFQQAPNEFVNNVKVDWGKVEGVDAQTAGELQRMGIKSVGDLEKMSPSERTKFEAEMKQKGVSWNWGKLGGWKTALGSTAAGVAGLGAGIANFGKGAIDKTGDALGAAGNVAGNVADATVKGAKGLVGGASSNTRVDAGSGDGDWSKVEGVDAQTAGELQRMGIKSVGELENMSPSERTKFEAEMKQKGVSWDWGKLDSWKTDQNQKSHLKGPHFGRPEVRVTGFAPVTEEVSKSAMSASNQGVVASGAATGTAASGFAASNVTGTGSGNGGAAGSINVGQVIAQDLKSTEPPRLFESTAQWKDDLTLLDGIGDPQSRELRKMGIYNFDQLHNLPHLEQARLQAWFGSKGWHLDMDQWRISSEGNTLNPSTELIQDKAYEVYCHRRDHHLCGDESTDWEQAEWAMRGNPIWGYGVPHDVEDYTQTMEGVTQEARDELYRMGLYNRHQVELLNEQERRLLTTWFAGPRFGIDLTKSFGWLSTLRPAPAPSDLNFGAVCESEPSQIDDLSRINGIGNATESDLNRLGIYHFSQIANWTAENSAAVAKTLGLENRIQEDSWIEQAKKLIERG